MTRRKSTPPPPLAKLSRPRLPAVATRGRLFRQLDSLRDLACTWVCGPAGSGKTTLVADYLRSGDEPSFWFHVDEGDLDPSAMISYLVALARRADPSAAALPYLTPDHQLDIEGFCRQFFRRFYQILPAECSIVFDNCHRAAGGSFHAVLRSAIEEAPSGVRLIALSRHQVPIDLVKVQANRQVAAIGADDLRLDPVEALAVMTALQMAEDAGAESLNAICDGWVAGLILMLAQVRGGNRNQPAQRLGLSSRDSIFAYFADELFQSAEPALRDLLLRTSLLQTVTPEHARELTGDSRAGERLEALYQQHFFTIRRESESGTHAATYNYHDLFRAFLIERLERSLGAAELKALRAKVAALLEQAGNAADAIDQYRLLESWSDVARLVRVESQKMIDQGRLQQLGDWLDSLPSERIASDPWLVLFSGHVTALANPPAAMSIFESAYDRFVATSDEAGQFSAAFALMETMMMNSPIYQPLDRWIDVLCQLLESRPPEEPERAVRAWHTLLLTCLYRRPSQPLIGTAVAVLETLLFSEKLQPTQAAQAATGLIAYAHFACDEALAARVIPALRRWLESDQIALMSRVRGAGWIMVYHYFDARYDEALHWAGTSLELARSHGFEAQTRILSWYRVQCLAHLGRREAALAEMAPLGPAQEDPLNSSPAAYAAASAAIAHFVAGDTRAAIALGDLSLAAWRENGFILAGLAWGHSTQAIYLMAAGETEAALALVAAAEAGLAGTVCNYPNALYCLLRAQAALTGNDRVGAIAHLQTCLAVSHNHKRIALLSWARPFLPRLFSLAWEEGIERKKVAELIAEWAIAPPSPDEPNWPRPLELYLLGDFQVRRLGEPIDFGRKPPRKLLGLLKAIAISGARGLSLDSARSHFWPDQDGDAAVASQSAALYRLRRLLGLPEAIRLSEGRMTLDPRLTWVDLAAFERLDASADEADRMRALSLYRGPLLPHDEDEPWSAAARMRLRDTFSRLVERVAVPLERSDPDTAERLYRRGIEAEPLAEASYRGLMRIHAQRGNASEVAAVFRRLRQTLSVVLGIEPSGESERLRREILEGAWREPYGNR